MRILELLQESFRLLLEQPKAFIPRLITTALYSIYTVFAAKLAADALAIASSQAGGQPDEGLLLGILFNAAILIASMPILYLVDLFSYAMYPRIVADHKAGGKISLTAALKDALKAWRPVVWLGVVVFAMVLAVGAFSFAVSYISIVTGFEALNILSVVIVVVALLAFSVAIFFVVPAAVLDGRGVKESFKESMSLGMKHKVSLLKLNIILMVLALVTLFSAFESSGSQAMAIASIVFYVLIRVLQAVVYTYLSVTNPLAYLSVRVNNDGKR